MVKMLNYYEKLKYSRVKLIKNIQYFERDLAPKIKYGSTPHHSCHSSITNS